MPGHRIYRKSMARREKFDGEYLKSFEHSMVMLPRGARNKMARRDSMESHGWVTSNDPIDLASD